MSEQPELPGGLWEQVVSILTSPEGAPELGIAPLRPPHKALLRSVTHTGDFPGFFLLSTQSPVVQALVKEELKGIIEAVLASLTGEELETVITVADPADDAEDSQPAEAIQPPAQHSGQTPSAASRPQQTQRQQPNQQQHQHQSGRNYPFPNADANDFNLHEQHQGSTQTPQVPQTHQPNIHNQPSAQSPRRSMDAVDSMAQGLSHSSAENPMTIADQRQVTSPFRSESHGTPTEMSMPFEEPTLNPNYTFETFVIGPQNKFAAAAAVAVAESPGRTYNPLFISGGSGLGKTHLLHGIGHYAKHLYPNLRVRYVSSEEFTNDFINSVRDDAQESFKRRYRDLDMLIIDDIQFLEGKEGTQEEFFHTFNALHQSNHQIVLSSDRPPRELKTLEDRLRTRFQWGLNPDLQYPDLETRIAILSKKAQLSDLVVPHDVLQYIAENTSSSIRELEGRLLQISAHASMIHEPVTLKFAQEILGADEIEVQITPEIIISTTAEYFDLTVADLVGPGKTRPVAHARQIAMYLTRSFTELSLPSIGREFGNRDHSTVLHAERKIVKEIQEKKPSKDQVNDLTTRIRDRARGTA
ncbi:chromosomal replication initiator protein DnaA [Corynebacterium sp. HFH0082]|uniref:chromosomal replication initiator protein DnaA n=1 Tax=Corynebacterium sp. HFH0082 TaxID=1078764 RepID=UPI00034EC913|nr:chromosomal replication initiator protein DnaA [Corynebacterium sp. HFH0082]EPD48466.1 chromosomal replication initiator protein DnaA [Corynebacterium sp. HFH0082]